MKIINYSDKELLGGLERVVCSSPTMTTYRDAIIKVLNENSDKTVRITSNLNAYITASSNFLSNPPSAVNETKSRIYLAACETLGRKIEKDADVFVDVLTRFAMAELLSGLRQALEKQ